MDGFAERIAIALERIVEPEPEEVEEFPPPKCPHCNTFNPTISTEDSKGTGSISSFVIRGHCNHCGKVIYAVSERWVLHPEYQMAEKHLESIKKRMEEN
jgi:phage FluMu protein Com